MPRTSTRESKIKRWSRRDKYGMTGLLNCCLFMRLNKKDFRLLAGMSKRALATIIVNANEETAWLMEAKAREG